MDGENNGKPYEQMDDLGGNTHIFGNTRILDKNNGLPRFREFTFDARPALNLLWDPVLPSDFTGGYVVISQGLSENRRKNWSCNTVYAINLYKSWKWEMVPSGLCSKSESYF